MPDRFLVRTGCAVIAAVLLAGAPRARAETARPSQGGQPPPEVERAALACRLGRWSAAAELLRGVERTQLRARDWLCLARAQVHLNQWVDALDSYDELMGSESPASRAARADGAVEREQLEHRLGWIQLVTSATLPTSVSLRLDGEIISPSRVGVAFPVQPGTHAFSVELEGEVRQVDHWRIAPGEHRTIGLSIPAPERAVAPSAAAQRQPKQEQSLPHFRAEPSGLERWAKRLVIGGGIAGGTGFLLLATSGGAREMLYAGLGTAALGGTSLLTGAGLYVAHGLGRAASSEAAEPPRPLQVQPWILSDGVGTGVSGSF